MLAQIRLQSEQKGELNRFLSKFYDTNLEIENKTKWTKQYKNPIEMINRIKKIINKYIIIFLSLQ